jgi:hypothetical protein
MLERGISGEYASGKVPNPQRHEDAVMSSEPLDRQQQKINEFLRLLPLTLEIAGMPRSELGRNFNADQMEVRANTIRAAYKIARQVVLEVAAAAK